LASRIRPELTDAARTEVNGNVGVVISSGSSRFARFALSAATSCRQRSPIISNRIRVITPHSGSASSAAYARPATIASSARIAHGLRSVPIAGLSPSIIRGIAREGDQGDGATPFAIAAGGGQSAKNRRQPTADRRGRPSL